MRRERKFVTWLARNIPRKIVFTADYFRARGRDVLGKMIFFFRGEKTWRSPAGRNDTRKRAWKHALKPVGCLSAAEYFDEMLFYPECLAGYRVCWGFHLNSNIVETKRCVALGISLSAGKLLSFVSAPTPSPRWLHSLLLFFFFFWFSPPIFYFILEFNFDIRKSTDMIFVYLKTKFFVDFEVSLMDRGWSLVRVRESFCSGF